MFILDGRKRALATAFRFVYKCIATRGEAFRTSEKMATSIAPDVRATELRRDNYETFHTSTGVGHHYRPGYYFPSSNFKTVIEGPLPPELATRSQVPLNEHYKTTSGTAHDYKPPGGAYGNRDPQYLKAPAQYNIKYVAKHDEQLQPGGWKKPLTMGNQTTETHEQFRAQPDTLPERPKEFDPNPQGFVYSNHVTDGPSKKVLPNTTNDKLKGKPFFVRDKGVADLMDPYLTTTNQHHRRFKPKELEKYPKKDIATYWECEEYPKSWGHGLKHNPVPKDSVPRQRPPMRDEMVFKTATKVHRVPPIINHVPHVGLNSEYTHKFQFPSDVKSKESAYHPTVDSPYTLSQPSNKSTFAAPNMYKTEYQNVGSNRPITC